PASTALSSASRSVARRYVLRSRAYRWVVSSAGAVAYRLPTRAPMLFPMTQVMGTSASRRASMAPKWATPLASPTLRTRQYRWNDFLSPPSSPRPVDLKLTGPANLTPGAGAARRGPSAMATWLASRPDVTTADE